eukprot:TRINITY_DN7944_c1_g4_i1.p1 TRINITY_DN7944_c1_g4~~TRINITY_DN7944_c1_g4_i1.p1  ORF type:complete len:804 (-),score=157.39 TRINITY_DN7944_c1_g4_i1:178-2589(-)
MSELPSPSRFKEALAQLVQAYESDVEELRNANAQLQQQLQGQADRRIVSTEMTSDVVDGQLRADTPAQALTVTLYGIRGLQCEELRKGCVVVVRVGAEERRVTSEKVVFEDAQPGVVSGTFDVVCGSVGQGVELTFEYVPASAVKLAIELWAIGQSSFSISGVLQKAEGRRTEDLGGACAVDFEIRQSAHHESDPSLLYGPYRETMKRFQSGEYTDAEQKLIQRWFGLFDVKDCRAKVVMSNDLVKAMKARAGLDEMVSARRMQDVLCELRCIEASLSGETRTTGLPVIGWTPFMNLMLFPDIASFASPLNRREIQALYDAMHNLRNKSRSIPSGAAVVGAPPLSRQGRWLSFIHVASISSILLSFFCLGFSLESDPDAIGWFCFELLITLIFIAEITTKVIVLSPRRYFMGKEASWNILDSFLTLLAVVDISIGMISFLDDQPSGGSGRVILMLRGLRLARVARLLKLMRTPLLKELVNMISGFLIGVPQLFWVFVMLGVVIYILAILLRTFILAYVPPGISERCGPGDSYQVGNMDNVPEPCNKLHYIYGDEYCGSVTQCMFSVFRCMIGDCTSTGGKSLTMILSDGFGTRFDVVYAFNMIWVLFGLFNVITAMFVEGTLSGLRYNSVQIKYAKLSEANFVHEKLTALTAKVASVVLDFREGLSESHTLLRNSGQKIRAFANGSGQEEEFLSFQNAGELCLTEDEFNFVISSAEVRQLLDDLDVAVEARPGVFEAFDTNNDGEVAMSELVAGFLRLRGQLHKVDVVVAHLKLAKLQEQLIDLQSQVQAKPAAEMPASLHFS